MQCLTVPSGTAEKCKLTTRAHVKMNAIPLLVYMMSLVDKAACDQTGGIERWLWFDTAYIHAMF